MRGNWSVAVDQAVFRTLWEWTAGPAKARGKQKRKTMGLGWYKMVPVLLNVMLFDFFVVCHCFSFERVF